MIAVRTKKAISKRLLLKAMKEIARIEVESPIQIDEAIIKVLVGTGKRLIATHIIKKYLLKTILVGVSTDYDEE